MPSTRYGWKKYYLNLNPKGNQDTITSSAINTVYSYRGSYAPTVKYNANGLYYSTEGGTWTKLTSDGVSHYYNVVNDAKYILCTSNDEMALFECPDELYKSGYQWKIGAQISLVSENNHSAQYSFYKYSPAAEKGPLNEVMSTSVPNAYTEGPNTDGFYYEFIGSDVIEPTAVKIQADRIQEGQSYMVYITPSPTPPVLTDRNNAFDVAYELQSRINGGAWSNLFQDPFTWTSVSITVPDGTDTLQLRVRAVDGTGYQSNYIQSPIYSTNQAPSSPGAVTVPSEVYPEKAFSVSWGAATDPDGNLSGYEVHRAYDGGTQWMRVGTSSTNSITTTVERGRKSVQYRVRAYDAKGEYSNWSYSNTAIVRNLRAYVGVSGKARKADKLYVGVNGKARKVVKGYIGVNGKARKFL